MVVAATVAAAAFAFGPAAGPPAPRVAVASDLVTDGTERTIAISLESGEAVRTDRLYVSGSRPVDVGGAPDSPGNTAADERFASPRERLTESAGGRPPQVGIGERWESGETVYVDPVGSVEGVTVSIYWNTEPVRGVNPGTVEGADSYRIATVEIGR